MRDESILGRILIIDDEKQNNEIIRDILEDVNYRTVLASSASEAKTIIALEALIYFLLWEENHAMASLRNRQRPVLML